MSCIVGSSEVLYCPDCNTSFDDESALRLERSEVERDHYCCPHCGGIVEIEHVDECCLCGKRCFAWERKIDLHEGKWFAFCNDCIEDVEGRAAMALSVVLSPLELRALNESRFAEDAPAKVVGHWNQKRRKQ